MTLQIHNLFDAFWKSTTDEICPNITFILRTQKHVHFDNFQFSRVNIATMPHYPCRETRYLKVTKFYQDWCDHPGPTFLSILFPFVSQRANSLGFTYKRIQWKIFPSAQDNYHVHKEQISPGLRHLQGSLEKK